MFEARVNEIYRHCENDLFQVKGIGNIGGITIVMYKGLHNSDSILQCCTQEVFFKNVESQAFNKTGQKYLFEKVCLNDASVLTTKELINELSRRANSEE